MSVLVVAAHDGKTVRANVANAVAAATQIGGDVHVLVAGSNAGEAAKTAAAIAGVAKVLQAEDAAYANWLAEDVAPLVVKLAANYGHVIMAADNTGKNLMPRVAALLDVAQVSEAIQIVSPDTFVRPIYAGNAMATVQSSDKVKVVTIRPTNFKAAAGGGSAAIEQIGGAEAAMWMARDYALQRMIFGRPLAGYQAIKHKLADVLMQVELARSSAYYAAWAAVDGPRELPRAAAAARLNAIDAFETAARENMQVHGGIAYTFEANCHFYYRRERTLALSLGGREQWADRLIDTFSITGPADGLQDS